MTELAIRVRGLGKQYRIGTRSPYRTLRETLVSGVRGATSWARRGSGRRPSGERQNFWALRDTSFEVARGEVVGIIGRNGAGKSTLLRLLSRVTTPTEGEIELHGTVGSLLEVGTGFHHELTGRENVYLSGAILGLRRSQIRQRFDSIVAFAEVEQFLDTPVKHYSSGMYMRLAFAVAAFLDADILLVDEVLAVGDAAFQAKCLGRMNAVAKEGRTILFVSHNMATIANLCTSGIYLDRGGVVFNGRLDTAIGKYMSALRSGRTESASNWQYLDTASFLDGGVRVGAETTVKMGDSIRIEVGFRTPSLTQTPVLGLVLRRETGEPVFGVNTRMTRDLELERPVDRLTVQVVLDALNLVQGVYVIDLFLGTEREDFETIEGALSMEVIETDVYGTGRAPFTHCGPIFVRPQINVIRDGRDT